MRITNFGLENTLFLHSKATDLRRLSRREGAWPSAQASRDIIPLRMAYFVSSATL